MHPRAHRLIFPEALPDTSPGSSATPSVLRVRPASPPPTGPGSQAALDLEPRELWIAAHVPQLSLLAVSAGTQAVPLVVLDDAHSRVIDADARAAAAGVRAGMTLGAALAAAPDIDARPRDAPRELEIMQRLAGIAATFTPLVSLAAPDGLLLEIKPSIRLFGGLRELCRRLRTACLASPVLATHGCVPHFTLAPTALAALVAARAGARCFITDPRVLPARLKPLPLAALRWSEEDCARLMGMGVRSLGELMRLPRAGFAKRFGAERLAELDRLLGRRADPRRRLARRERFRERLDLDHEIESQEQVLQALQPLLATLEQYLRARQRGITALQCRFHHHRAPPTLCTLRLAQPEAHADRLASLLRERLANLTLPEPVRRCELVSGALTARRLASRPLWAPGERGHATTGEMPALVEQLRARLGASAVHGLRRHAEHRPECAWRMVEPALEPVTAAAGVAVHDRALPPAFRRPLWLLAQPEPLAQREGRPQYRGALELLEGPERIESGWWDGVDVQRDYYVARDSTSARLWIYRDRAGARGWFLHGIFG
jgi:protein ImuB